MWPNPQFHVDLVIFTEEIFNGKLYFLCEKFFVQWKVGKDQQMPTMEICRMLDIQILCIWHRSIKKCKLIMKTIFFLKVISWPWWSWYWWLFYNHLLWLVSFSLPLTHFWVILVTQIAFFFVNKANKILTEICDYVWTLLVFNN